MKTFADRDLALPPSPGEVEETCSRLLAVGERWLRARPVAEIIRSLASWGKRWRNPRWPMRQVAEQALAESLGFSRAMVARSLDLAFQDLTERSLWALVRESVGTPRALDSFVRRGGRFVHAWGPRVVVQVFAGNVFTAPIQPLVHALLAKSASLCKLSSRERVFPQLLKRTLAEIDFPLSESVAILHWKGGDAGLETSLFERAGAVVAFGDDETMAALRARVPWRVPFFPYGHRVSVAVVGRDALAKRQLPALARALAEDVVLFDQAGCLSPRTVYVQEGGEAVASELAERLSEALAYWTSQYGPPAMTLEEEVLAQQARGEAYATEPDVKRTVFASPDLAWTVVYEESLSPKPEGVPRFIWVKPFAEPGELVAHLEPLRGRIQAVALTWGRGRHDVARLFSSLGVSRFPQAGRLQAPPLLWHQDGRDLLAHLIRWSDLE